jgi:transposase
VTGSVDAATVIACIDEFADSIKKKTVLVPDSATIHHSQTFNARLGEWIKKGLRIFHLPTYSPHLNPIETLWRKIKYDRLKPSDYSSREALKMALYNILTSVGQKFKIEFEELRHFNNFKAAFI